MKRQDENLQNGRKYLQTKQLTKETDKGLNFKINKQLMQFKISKRKAKQSNEKMSGGPKQAFL